MAEVLALAGKALDEGELPIAAIVVLDGRPIAQAWTQERAARRYLVHADLQALLAVDQLGLCVAERRRCTLYVNLEPCPMCLGAAMSACMGRVVYALESPSDGAVDLFRAWRRPADDMPIYRLPEIIGGVLRSRSRDLFACYTESACAGGPRDWAQSLTNQPHVPGQHAE
jgi:tRNA(adenine34) deaminase